MVLVGHTLALNHFEGPRSPQNFGVVIFFVLSGFLITYSVLSKGREYSFAHYLIDRASRIFVPYLPALAFIIIVGLTFHLPGRTDFKTALAHLFMLQGYPLAQYFPQEIYFEPLGTGRPLWTVAIEWWFYCTFGALLFIGSAKKVSPKFLVLIILGLVVVMFNMASTTMAWPWLGGSVGAYLFLHSQRSFNARYLTVLLIGFTILRYYFHRDSYDLQGMLLAAMTLISLTLSFSEITIPTVLTTAGTFIAQYSYSLYLLHYTVVVLLVQYMGEGIGPLIAEILVSNLVAFLFFLCFEAHYHEVARWLKRRVPQL